MDTFVIALLTQFANYWQLPEFKKFLKVVAVEELLKGSISEYKAWGSTSPKLSKVLAALGLNNQEVSEVCGFLRKPSTESRVTAKKEEMLDQGNSIHFSSCQATDERSKFMKEDADTTYQYKLVEDLQYAGKSLFLWVVGQPMHIDGRGYEARAKVRIITDLSKRKVMGLYIDRMYGHTPYLYLELDRLKALWDAFSIKRGWELTPLLERDGGGDDNGYCPSCHSGYQDTIPNELGCYVPLAPVADFSDISWIRTCDFNAHGVHTWSTKQIRFVPNRNVMYKVPDSSPLCVDHIDQRSRKRLHEEISKSPCYPAVKAGYAQVVYRQNNDLSWGAVVKVAAKTYRF